MRDIKFRAWDKYRNKMIYNIQNEFEERITLGMNCFGDYLNDKDFDVMQYTGLKDINGKEIYEGDIDSYGYIVTHVGDVKECLGMNCGWYLQRDDFESWCQIVCREDEIEIVGNIYENSELIK